MKTKRISIFLVACLALLAVAGTKVSQLTQTKSVQSTSRFLVSTQDATSGRWSSRFITAPDLATNLGPWITNTSVGGGSATNAVTSTNGNQFLGVPLSIKSGSTETNKILYPSNTVGQSLTIYELQSQSADTIKVKDYLGNDLVTVGSGGAITSAGNIASTGGDISGAAGVFTSTLDVTGSASFGSNLRADGELQVGNKRIKYTVGNGSPESVVSANPQSVYLDTNQTSGIGWYLKTNGTSSTGWWLLTPGGGGGSGDVTTAQLNTASNLLRTDFVAGDTTTSNALVTLANAKQSGSGVLTNLISTGAHTNQLNSWEVWSAVGTTNSYFAENRGLGVLTNSTNFGSLMQSIFNRGVDATYIKIRSNPYYTNHFELHSTIYVTNMMVVEGEGNSATTIRAGASLNGPMFQLGEDSGGVRNGGSGITRFKNLRFESDLAGTAGVGIKVIKCSEPVFEDCEWTGFKFAAIQLSSTNYIHWSYAEDCWFVMKDSAAHGILIDQSPLATQNQNHFRVENCKFGIFGGGTPIVVSNWFPGLTIQNSHFRYSSGTIPDTAAISVWAGDRYNIDGNEFFNFSDAHYPIYFQDRGSATNYHTTVSNNKITGLGLRPSQTFVAGTFVQGIADIGNTGWTDSSWIGAGDNGTINSIHDKGITMQTLTASRALTLNASSDVTNATTTLTELNYLSGVTANLTVGLSNSVRVAAGTGGITVTPSGSGGIMTYTINDDDAGGGSGGTNFPAVLLQVGNTNLTLQAGKRTVHSFSTNGAHGVDADLAVPASGHVFSVIETNSSGANYTVTFYTNGVAATFYDIATKTNATSWVVPLGSVVENEFLYTAAGWFRTHFAGPELSLAFAGNMVGHTNGLLLTISNTPPTAIPAGADTQVQFNDGGTTAGSPSNTFNKTTGVLRLISSSTAPGLNLRDSAGNSSGFGPSLWYATNTSIQLTALTNTWTFSGSEPRLFVPSTGISAIGSTASHLKQLFADQILYENETVLGVGGANTNFTFTPVGQFAYVNGGLTNVHIVAIMPDSSSKPFYKTIVISNLTSTSRQLSQSSVSNHWFNLSAYSGFQFPITITNNHSLFLSTMVNGTNVWTGMQIVTNGF